MTGVSTAGHRLTVAPETSHSYEPDNAPCDVLKKDGRLSISDKPGQRQLRRTLEIAECEHCGGFELRQILENTGDMLCQGTPWTITCVKPAGPIVIPWGYGNDRWSNNKVCYLRCGPHFNASPSNSQWRPDDDVFTIEPNGQIGKVGLFAEAGSMALLRPDCTFIMHSPPTAAESRYPDGGCNIEVYTSPDFVELEFLGPLETIHPVNG